MRVEIGPKRIESIRTKVQEALRIRERKLVHSIDPFREGALWQADFITSIEAVTWGTHAHLRAQMPTNWYDYPKSVNLELYTALPHDNGLAILDIFLECNPTLPPNTDRTIKMSISDFVEPLRGHLQEWAEARKEHIEYGKVSLVGILNFLNAAKTLNEALEQFPDLEMYVDPHDLARVKAPTSSAVRAIAVEKPDVAAVDFAALSLLGAIAKL